MKPKTKLGLTAIATAAGAYFLYGKDGDKNRKKLKSWMLRAKADVMEKIEKAKELGKEDYDAIVTTVEAKYKKLKSTDDVEVQALMKKLKSQWTNINREIKKATAPATKKAAKKTTKKK
ncbi:MAG: hypothetical protein OEX08_01725 [Candidatus Nomurabacteria bacterium]|nr:hypothetical protein [Candidatus Nomurabacteria bacterium]